MADVLDIPERTLRDVMRRLVERDIVVRRVQTEIGDMS